MMMSSIVVLLKTERLAGDSIETCRFKLEEVVVVQCAVIGSRPRCMVLVCVALTSVHVSSLTHAYPWGFVTYDSIEISNYFS